MIHVIQAALCDLELENHRRVVMTLRKALAAPSVPYHTRMEALLEIKQRRELIVKLLTVKQRAQQAAWRHRNRSCP